MSDEFSVSVCQGKYEYHYKEGKQWVLRYGEPWPACDADLSGNKFVFSLAVELDEAQKEAEMLRGLVREMEEELRGVRSELMESRANDRTAMGYLSEIRQALKFEGDFPALIQKIKSDGPT